MITAEQKRMYDEQGYVVVHGLFSPEEVARFRDHFMALRENGICPGDDVPADATSDDPLRRYPRMLQMHRWDELSLRYLLDTRIRDGLVSLLNKEPYAVQTMMYFKPPGARGQALHQDQYFLRVQPGTCMAAWMALDRCDEENGCMRVVPGSHTWPLLCTTKADTTQSFSDITVPIPEGTPIDAVRMEPGDVLFFNGSLVHGSFPNTSQDRFRRSLIAHYIQGEAEQVYEWYHPALRMDGTPIELGFSERGSKCGVWTDVDGVSVIEMNGREATATRRE